MEIERFGQFIKTKRLEAEVTLMELSEKMEISVAYLSDIENGRRKPMDSDKMEILIKELHLTSSERDRMYDLAGKERNEISPDLVGYTMDSDVAPYIRTALRKARENNATIKDWKRIINELDKKNGGNSIAGIQLD